MDHHITIDQLRQAVPEWLRRGEAITVRPHEYDPGLCVATAATFPHLPATGAGRREVRSVYLASKFDRGAEMRGYAQQLMEAGFDITADWIYGLEPEDPADIALKDVEDVLRADALIAFTEDVDETPGSTGGRHVELGIAIATGKRVLVVGPRENVFCHLPQIEYMSRWDAREANRRLGGAGRFSPVSLGDWLRLAGRTGVPFVPAEKIAEIHRDDWMRFDVPGEHHECLLAVVKAIRDAAEPRTMVRWDCCAGQDLKMSMEVGNFEWTPDKNELILDDPRAIQIIDELPYDVNAVWKRPWIAASVEDGFPVEYRVFVRDGLIQGISSYYPQRPLTEHPEHLAKVREYTERLIDAAEPPFAFNRPVFAPPHDLDPNGIHFTADFIVAEDGEVLFLEGNPPHELGGHQCCFLPGQIDGVALRDRNEGLH